MSRTEYVVRHQVVEVTGDLETVLGECESEPFPSLDAAASEFEDITGVELDSCRLTPVLDEETVEDEPE